MCPQDEYRCTLLLHDHAGWGTQADFWRDPDGEKHEWRVFDGTEKLELELLMLELLEDDATQLEKDWIMRMRLRRTAQLTKKERQICPKEDPPF